jgi:hypothetical protein
MFLIFRLLFFLEEVHVYRPINKPSKTLEDFHLPILWVQASFVYFRTCILPH